MATTLSQYQAAVLRRCGLENVPSAGLFITSTDVIDYINFGYLRLWNRLVRVLGEGWARNSYTFSVSSGTSLYALPADFGRTLISVDVSLGGNIYVSAKPYTEEERNRYRSYPNWLWVSGWPIFYQLQGTNINFIPTPAGIFSVTLNYVPAFTPLANASDTINAAIPAGLDEYFIWSAVADIQAKEESDASFALGKMAQLELLIDEIGHERQTAGAHRVRDTTSAVDYWRW